MARIIRHLFLVLLVSSCLRLSADEPQPRRGVVRFETSAIESKIPERFRLANHEFTFAEVAVPGFAEDKRVGVANVTFPSPVVTPVEANNTVHCEFYYPKDSADTKRPAIVVLHILGGDFPLARLFAATFAERGVAALFLKMPYYGPRRDPKLPARMVSRDPHETIAGMTQAVLDIRRGVAFLASRPDIDPERLGIFGISLGGITGALAATAEPRLQNVCLLLAGGDIGQVGWEAKELAKIRDRWLENGGTKEQFLDLMRQVDPARYGETVRGRRILMLNAKDDEIIPRACTESLWRSFGEPEIVWYNGGHYSVARHILDALDRSGRFFTSTRKAQP